MSGYDPDEFQGNNTFGRQKGKGFLNLTKQFATSRVGMFGALLALYAATFGIGQLKEDPLDLFSTKERLHIETARQLEEMVESDQSPAVREEIQDRLQEISKKSKNGLEYEAKTILIRKAIDAGFRNEVRAKFLNADLRKAIEEKRLDAIDTKTLAEIAWYALCENKFSDQAYIDIAEKTLVVLDNGSFSREKRAYVKKLMTACMKDGVFNEEEMKTMTYLLLDEFMERPEGDGYRQAIEKKLGTIYMKRNADKMKGMFKNDNSK
ncbi:MAG: hypothetical protein KAT43_03930 [Nanoarchaeota archaeon]|nr:hypothetical protein [Nanoarchaeota archaeon]